MRYFISYDIKENKIRNKVAKFLEGIGYRVQYSLFMADLCDKELLNTKMILEKIIKKAENALLLVVPVCKSCENKIWKQGEFREENVNCVVV